MFTSKDYSKASASILILLFVAGLLVGGLLIYYVSYRQVFDLNGQITNLQTAFSNLEGRQNATYQNITILQNGTSLAEIYSNLQNSVVLVQGETTTEACRARDLFTILLAEIVVLTNYHVVQDTTDLSVTFSDGHGYSATVLRN